jgi:hypothetical protein
LPRLLGAGLLLEGANLFSIAVTSGLLRLLPGPADRFADFALHASLFWVLFVARERAADTASVRRRLLWARWLVLAACLAGALVYFQHGQRLSADGPHYFVQARSMLFDGDLRFENDYELVRAPKPIAARYPVGSALLSMPFLAFAHLLLLLGQALGRGLEPSGFGYAYETAFGLAGYFFASWALLRVLSTTARTFPVGISLLALASVATSSFLAWYMLVEPSMPHAMSFAWTSFFLCYWLDHRPLDEGRRFVVLGALAGIAALVRWQNGVLLLLPLADELIGAPASWKKAGSSVFASLVVFTPQLVFWGLTASSAVAVPLAGHDVSFTQLSILEVLYSTNRGLFPWNPILYLSILGLFVWARASARLALLCLAGFCLELYVNASVGIWWSGWSFGGRRFDTSILFFVLGAAALFELLKRRSTVMIVGLAGGLALWNYGLARQARSGRISPDRLVSFRQVSLDNVDAFYDRFGFPFAWPANWIFSWRYGVAPAKFDRLFGHEGFGNFRVEFDEESEPYLGAGWGEPEKDGAGEVFRWALDGASSLLVPLKTPRDYELEVELRPYGPTAPNRIYLSVNGGRERLRLVPERSVLKWTVGRDRWVQGVNELRFEFERVSIPSDEGSSTDSRRLAAAFYRLSLVAIPD